MITAADAIGKSEDFTEICRTAWGIRAVKRVYALSVPAVEEEVVA